MVRPPRTLSHKVCPASRYRRVAAESLDAWKSISKLCTGLRLAELSEARWLDQARLSGLADS